MYWMGGTVGVVVKCKLTLEGYHLHDLWFSIDLYKPLAHTCKLNLLTRTSASSLKRMDFLWFDLWKVDPSQVKYRCHPFYDYQMKIPMLFEMLIN